MAKNEEMYSSLSDDVLAALSKDGDDNAFNELAIRYIGRIRFIGRKYSARGYEQNDFLQEGLTALYYACLSYDPDAGSAFASFASLLINRRFLGIIRRAQAKKAVPDSALTPLDDEALDGLGGYAPSPEEKLLGDERLGQVLKWLRGLLSVREYEVLILFASGLGYSKISKQLNISEKSVDNALQRVRRKVGATKCPEEDAAQFLKGQI